MPQRSGLCIGGPKDGQLMVQPYDYFETVVAPTWPWLSAPPPGDELKPVELTLTRFTYKYQEFFKSGFWVDASQPFDPEHFTKMLAFNYRGKA